MALIDFDTYPNAATTASAPPAAIPRSRGCTGAPLYDHSGFVPAAQPLPQSADGRLVPGVDVSPWSRPIAHIARESDIDQDTLLAPIRQDETDRGEHLDRPTTEERTEL